MLNECSGACNEGLMSRLENFQGITRCRFRFSANFRLVVIGDSAFKNFLDSFRLRNFIVIILFFSEHIGFAERLFLAPIS
jgi:hypothetical protein